MSLTHSHTEARSTAFGFALSLLLKGLTVDMGGRVVCGARIASLADVIFRCGLTA